MPVIIRKNLNRYRKVYPGIRKPGVYDQAKKMEASALTLVGENSASYVFKHSYTVAPAVVATVYDSSGSGEVSTNVFIVSITTTQVTLETSANITGTIHIQVIEV